MSAKYPYYFLADSREGRAKEQSFPEKSRPIAQRTMTFARASSMSARPTFTLKSIANNAEIDVLWEEAQQTLEPLRARLNAALGTAWEEWQIPRDPDPKWSAEITKTHAAWWEIRIERQKRIDASIARAPTSNTSTTGPTRTTPHPCRWPVHRRKPIAASRRPRRRGRAVRATVERPASAGRPRCRRSISPPWCWSICAPPACTRHRRRQHPLHRLQPWPGEYIGAEGRFLEGETERRAGILIGPEFGTVSRMDLVAAAREASEARSTC